MFSFRFYEFVLLTFCHYLDASLICLRPFILCSLAPIPLDMASSSQNGIQLLLAAEQEAQHIVNAARTGDDLYPGIHACIFCYLPFIFQ